MVIILRRLRRNHEIGRLKGLLIPLPPKVALHLTLDMLYHLLLDLLLLQHLLDLLLLFLERLIICIQLVQLNALVAVLRFVIIHLVRCHGRALVVFVFEI